MCQRSTFNTLHKHGEGYCPFVEQLKKWQWSLL